MVRNYWRAKVVGLLAVVAATFVELVVAPAWSQVGPAGGPPGAVKPADSPFVREPTSAEDLLDAVVLMVRLGKPETARYYLERLMEMDLTPELLFELREQHGPMGLYRLAQVKELRPLAADLLQRANEAAIARARDPERIARLIELLGASPEERAWAVVELQGAGVAAVPHLLRALQKADGLEQRANVFYALVKMGENAVPALLGALEAQDAETRLTVIGALAEIGDPTAIPYLLPYADSSDVDDATRSRAREAVARIAGQPVDTLPSAVSTLRTHARRYYELGPEALGPVGDEPVELWSWNQEERVPVPNRVAPADAARLLGIRFAREALRLRSEDRETQLLLLSLMLEAEAAAGGDSGEPLPEGPGSAHDLALAAGPEPSVLVLRRALSEGRSLVALAATRLLGRIGDESLLHGNGPEPGLLIEAINYPDPRVQFAAAEAVLRLRPSRPFVGSQRVVSVLARTLRTEGKPKALVADVRVDRGRQLATMLEEIGYAAEIAESGREAFVLAAESPDYDLIVLDPMILRFGLSQTIANLQADARTAGIPVLVAGPLAIQDRVNGYEERYPGVNFVVRPVTSDDLRQQVEPILADLQVDPMTSQERTQRARRALSWLLRLARGELKVFDPVAAEDAFLRALLNPELAPDAVLALGVLPTRDSQRRLADTLLSSDRPVELRKSAAEQLCFSIQKFGLLLTEDQIEAVHLLHGRASDAGLHAAVAAVIGCLGSDATLAGHRLRSYEPGLPGASRNIKAPRRPVHRTPAPRSDEPLREARVHRTFP